MSTFKEANQVRVALKMKLSVYAWYKGSAVSSASDGWGVTIWTSKVDNTVRKAIPPVIDGVAIKTEIE